MSGIVASLRENPHLCTALKHELFPCLSHGVMAAQQILVLFV